MKKSLLILILLVICSISVYAIDFNTEYENYQGQFTYQNQQANNLFINIDSCILKNNYNDPCFSNLLVYQETNLPQRKAEIDNLKGNIISLGQQYLSSGGSKTDTYYKEVDDLQSQSGLLSLQVEDKLSLVNAYINIKTLESYTKKINDLQDEYILLSIKLDVASNVNSFNTAKAEIENAKQKLDSLQQDVENFCNGNTSPSCSGITTPLNNLENNINTDLAKSYSSEEDETPSANSGIDISQLEDVLLNESNQKKNETQNQANLETTLLLLKQIEELKKKIENEKAKTTDPVRLSELNNLEKKNDELYSKIANSLKNNTGGVELNPELIKIDASSEYNEQKEPPKVTSDIITFLVLGIIILGFLYFVFKHRNSTSY